MKSGKEAIKNINSYPQHLKGKPVTLPDLAHSARSRILQATGVKRKLLLNELKLPC
jgi:hypothetical protein